MVPWGSGRGGFGDRVPRLVVSGYFYHTAFVTRIGDDGKMTSRLGHKLSIVGGYSLGSPGIRRPGYLTNRGMYHALGLWQQWSLGLSRALHQ